MPWRPVPLSYGVAIYPFQPGSSTAELPLQIGDQLYVIEQGGDNGDWYRGYLVAPPSLLSALNPDGRGLPGADARVFSGIFPKCYVEIREELGESLSRPGSSRASQLPNEKPQAPVPMLKIGDETTLSSEPLVDEISSCLREWYLLQLPDLVLDREYDLLEKIAAIMTQLEYARRELLNDVLTDFERIQLRSDAVMNLVRASKMLSGQVIVRDRAGRLLTGEDSAIEISKQTVFGVLLDITETEKNSSSGETNGHGPEGEDGRMSSLGYSGSVRGRATSRLSKRLSKVSITNGHSDSKPSTLLADRSNQILPVQEDSSDEVLVDLLRWKHLSSVQLMDLLPKVMFVPEDQIVDKLEDVFDSLFAILVHKSGESKYEDLIFNNLVRVFGITNDRRYDIAGVVEQYLEEQFESPFAAPCLLRSLTRLLQSVSDPQSARDLRAFFKVGRYIIKLLITSHQQSKLNPANSNLIANHRTFKEDTQAIFFGLEMMMRSETPALIGSKTLLIQHFHTWLPELLPAFSKDEVMRIAINFVDSCQDARGKLLLHRLILIQNYTKLDQLWQDAQDRLILLKHCRMWLSPYWGTTREVDSQWREQIRLCCSVISGLLRYPSSAVYDFMPKIISSYAAILSARPASRRALSYLFPETYPLTSKSVTPNDQADEAILELAAIISMICRIAAPPVIDLREQTLSSYILAILETQKSILECATYPETWLSLNLYHHRSALTILKYVSGLLMQNFLPAPEFAERFEMDLWKEFFNVLLKLVCSEILALENFSEQKRRLVWKIAGDVREEGANLLRRNWEAIGWETSADDERRYNLKHLGGFQVQYVPSLIPPIMELCVSMHEGLRGVAVEILQTMIVSEWALSEDLGMIETEMIASLDKIFKGSPRINETTDKLFITELRELFATIADQPDDDLWTALDELLLSIDQLISLLTARNSSTDGSDALHTLRLTEFMQSMRNEEIFIRYIHELAHEYDGDEKPVDAALTLQRHAVLHEWDPNNKLPASTNPKYPEQSAFERKEAIYLAMIQRFEDGQAWTDAMKCYKELAEQYENTTMEFGKLARAQRAMARINEERAVSRAESVGQEMNGAARQG